MNNFNSELVRAGLNSLAAQEVSQSRAICLLLIGDSYYVVGVKTMRHGKRIRNVRQMSFDTAIFRGESLDEAMSEYMGAVAGANHDQREIE